MKRTNDDWKLKTVGGGDDEVEAEVEVNIERENLDPSFKVICATKAE